jgi:hypothetical protein
MRIVHSKNRSHAAEGLLDKTERVDAPPQLNPFAKAQRESKPEKQAEML